MNVATIDFDIIMAPVIGSYNDIVDVEYTIDDMIEKFPYMRSALPDFYIYDYLTQFITQVFQYMDNINEVYFIESHEEIIPYIEGDDNILYNIDHHHDIGYNTKDLTLRIREADCSNWAKYLKEIGNIKEYYWIHDEYSEEIDDKKILTLLNGQYELKDINLLDLGKKINKLIICYSVPWVPSNYRGLYSNWQSIWDGFKILRIDKNK